MITPETQDLPPLPDVLAKRYVLAEELGRGGMGVVFRCTDMKSGAERAAKLLTLSVAEEKSEIRRFAQEAKLLTRFQHPNILRVHDFGLEGKYPFLITELCANQEGQPNSLADLISVSPERQLSSAQLDRLLPPIIGALADLHNAGLVHRDIKPANILLHHTPEGEVAKLADFGLVALTGDQQMRDIVDFTMSMSMEQESASGQALVGTYAYMSPEQKRGEVVDARSDVYSLGLMIYRLSTGYDRVSFALPSEIVDDLPGWVDEIVKASVDTDKEQRADSAEALFAMLPAEYQRRIPRQIRAKQGAPAPAQAPALPPRDGAPAEAPPSEVLVPVTPPQVKAAPAPKASFAASASARYLPWLAGAVAMLVVVLLLVVLVMLIRRATPDVPATDPRTVAELLASDVPIDVQSGLKRAQQLPPDEAVDLVPALAQLLQHPDASLRGHATNVVGELSQEVQPLRALLITAASDPDPTVAIYAIQAMQTWIAVSPEAIAAAHARFQNGSPKLRQEAAAMLDQQDVPINPAYTDYFLHANRSGAIAQLGERALPAIRDALASGDPRRQQQALAAGAMLGPTAAPIADDLAAVLGHNDRELRLAAVRALREIGDAAIPPLLTVLHQGNGQAQAHALDLLNVLKPTSRSRMLTEAWIPYHLYRADVDALIAIGARGMPRLMTFYEGGSPTMQQTILSTVQSLRREAAPAAELLTRRLIAEHRDSGGEAIIDALAAIGPAAAEARPILIEILNDRSMRAARAGEALYAIGVPNERDYLPYFLWAAQYGTSLRQRLDAVETLAEAGITSSTARERLLTLLERENNEAIAQAAGEALAKLGDRAVPGLLRLLDKPPPAPLRSLRVLARIGPADEQAIAALVRFASTPDPALALAAIDALIAIRDPAVPPLIEAIHVPALRTAAIRGLAQIGRPALIRLRNELTYSDRRDFRDAIMEAICRMGEAAAPALPDIQEALRESHRYTLTHLLDSITHLGPTGAPLLEELLALTDSPRTEVRQKAIDAMRAIGRAGSPHLGTCLTHPSPDVGQAALKALTTMGPDAAGALPHLNRLFASGTDETRTRIVQTVQGMANERVRALPMLTKAVNDEAPSVRLIATRTLADMGPAARPALPALQKIADDRSVSRLFRQAATDAIQAIQAP